MAGSTFGQAFQIHTFGESHGKGIGVVIDGCPAGLPIDLQFVQYQLHRRRPGQSNIVTQRKETDTIEVLSGIFQGKTTGTPIAIFIHNKDARSKDYSHIANKFRPSHADFTYQQKYGFRDYRGGGRSSARETAARVAAGAIARLLLQHYGIQIHAFVRQVGHIQSPIPYPQLDFEQIEATPVRCPDLEAATQMIKYIQTIRKQGDTTGGIVEAVIKDCPTGLGNPVFDKLHADLGKAMLSINACKGFEYGSGFEGVSMRGSQHNDPFYTDGEKVRTKTNYSGGIQGGISNGMDIYFKVAFKPVATIMTSQQSLDSKGNSVEVAGKGRHDPCVVPRAVPIVEAMAALVIADHLLLQRMVHL